MIEQKILDSAGNRTRFDEWKGKNSIDHALPTFFSESRKIKDVESAVRLGNLEHKCTRLKALVCAENAQ